MKSYNHLYEKVISLENLFLAEKKARKRKTLKPYIIKFEENLDEELHILHQELASHNYNPYPLKTFIIREPKTRKISKSEFRDRIVHHAICNILEPIYEKKFIYDSCANRRGKGTFLAVRRFEKFKYKISRNLTKVKGNAKGYVFKADIKHYFETVNHDILLAILRKTIRDETIISLIIKILKNYDLKGSQKGMPLGNLTSQFFANIYLNELDQFVKHKLKLKYYIRYVDDFVIFHGSKSALEELKKQISDFLKEKLCLELHPEKSKIFPLHRGVNFLGLRIFPHHKLLRKRNIHKLRTKLSQRFIEYNNEILSFDDFYNILEGWISYAKNGNTYKLRNIINNEFKERTKTEVSSKEVSRFLKMNFSVNLSVLSQKPI